MAMKIPGLKKADLPPTAKEVDKTPEENLQTCVGDPSAVESAAAGNPPADELQPPADTKPVDAPPADDNLKQPSPGCTVYSFEFDVMEVTRKIETIIINAEGETEDIALSKAAADAKTKITGSQHLRYTQKSKRV